MPTSCISGAGNAMDMILNLRVWFPFSDGDMENGYNGRSPANGWASVERGWIVESRNGRDYRDDEENCQST
jgi:hypothetical protein